ncbi:TPA: hypothetical protein DDW35_12775 [Candidatus Sumerlaeota bacterium]|jgi:hypothetical protein|nr:hypothetical protein [Candidatus Sumerlaeota bacterium]
MIEPVSTCKNPCSDLFRVFLKYGKNKIPRQTCPDGVRKKASAKSKISGSSLARLENQFDEGGRRWNHEDWVSGYPYTTGTSPAGEVGKFDYVPSVYFYQNKTERAVSCPMLLIKR